LLALLSLLLQSLPLAAHLEWRTRSLCFLEGQFPRWLRHRTFRHGFSGTLGCLLFAGHLFLLFLLLQVVFVSQVLLRCVLQQRDLVLSKRRGRKLLLLTLLGLQSRSQLRLFWQWLGLRSEGSLLDFDCGIVCSVESLTRVLALG